MKKTILLIGIIALLITIVGCDSDAGSAGSGGNSGTNSIEFVSVFTDKEQAIFSNTSIVNGIAEIHSESEGVLILGAINALNQAHSSSVYSDKAMARLDKYMPIGNGFSVKRFSIENNEQNYSMLYTISFDVKQDNGEVFVVKIIREEVQNSSISNTKINWKGKEYSVSSENDIKKLPNDLRKFFEVIEAIEDIEPDPNKYSYVTEQISKAEFTTESAHGVFTTARREAGGDTKNILIIEAEFEEKKIYIRALAEDLVDEYDHKQHPYATQILYVQYEPTSINTWTILEFRIDGTAYNPDSVEAFFTAPQP